MEFNTVGNLREYIISLAKSLEFDTVCSLDKYLRSILAQIYQYKDEKPTFHHFAYLFQEGLSATPLPFDDSWFDWVEPPYMNFEPHPDDFDNLLINRETNEVVSKFEVFEKTLVFQIADIKKIDAANELENIGEGSTAGIISPTGNEWYNLDVINYMLASVSGIMNNSDTECDWLTITDIIEYGRTSILINE